MKAPFPSPVATSQPPQLCRTRRCSFCAATLKFPLRRPQWAEARRTFRPNFARRKVRLTSQQGVSRNWGSGGKMTVSTAAGLVLTGIVPRRRFGYFAAAGKVTSVLLKRKRRFFPHSKLKMWKEFCINKPRCKFPHTGRQGRTVHCRSPPRWAARRPARHPSGQ